jgi:hypothetical protein
MWGETITASAPAPRPPMIRTAMMNTNPFAKASPIDAAQNSSWPLLSPNSVSDAGA